MPQLTVRGRTEAPSFFPQYCLEAAHRNWSVKYILIKNVPPPAQFFLLAQRIFLPLAKSVRPIAAVADGSEKRVKPYHLSEIQTHTHIDRGNRGHSAGWAAFNWPEMKHCCTTLGKAGKGKAFCLEPVETCRVGSVTRSSQVLSKMVGGAFDLQQKAAEVMSYCLSNALWNPFPKLSLLRFHSFASFYCTRKSLTLLAIFIFIVVLPSTLK